MPDREITIKCTVEGFTDNWLKINMDRWSVRETEELEDSDMDGLISLFRRKVVDGHVEMNTGEILTGPDDFTREALLDCDELVLGWLGGVFATGIVRRKTLGNVNARLSSISSEQTAPTKT